MGLRIGISPPEYTILFYLTVGIVVAKISLAIYLARKLLVKKKQQENKIAMYFLGSVLFFLLTLIVSRILYVYFDFFLTGFNAQIYHLPPQIHVWKAATFLSSMGLGIVAIVVDLKILRGKFKGIFAYIIIGGGIFLLFYPVRVKSDFDLISLINIITSAGIIFVPIIFIWIGKITPPLRKTAWGLAAGTILLAVANIIVNEGILSPLRESGGFVIQNLMYLLQAILKVISYSLISYFANKFKL
ncbi:MAG: hypothetical protein ACTSWN_10130 [Promethearchaeota archaeon]